MANYFLKTTGQVSVTYVENRFSISTVVVLESCNNIVTSFTVLAIVIYC